MISLDRVLCDCCGDDMGQIMGGIPTAAGVICDQNKAPHFAVCPDCTVDACEYLALPVPDCTPSLQLSGPYTRDEFTDIVTSPEHWA